MRDPVLAGPRPVQTLGPDRAHPTFRVRVRPGTHGGILTTSTPGAPNTASNPALNLGVPIRSWTTPSTSRRPAKPRPTSSAGTPAANHRPHAVTTPATPV